VTANAADVEGNRGVTRSDSVHGRAFIEAREVTKRYGGVPALRSVSVGFAAGQVHGLVGANGAGKSTLIKVLTGVERADEGEVLINGTPVQLATPRHAHHLGVQCIHQELNLVPNFTALQNLALSYDGGSRLGFLTPSRVQDRAEQVMARLGAHFPLDVEVDRLTVTQRWFVALGQGLMANGRLIVMDEPSTSFTHSEVEQLFDVIRSLRESGEGVVYVSHRLDEILEICDEVTVMRDGEVVENIPRVDLTRDRLVHSIVGRAVEPVKEVARAHDAEAHGGGGGCVFMARGLASGALVKDVSFEVAAGEIVGLAGLVGSGRTELARVLAGADRVDAGSMTLDGEDYRPRSSRAGLAKGVAMVPEERRAQSLLLLESIAFNASLSTLDSHRGRFMPLLDVRAINAQAGAEIMKYGIKARSPRQSVLELSGGNQQKVVVSRLVQTGPKLIVLDEPTVGMDINAKKDLYQIIVALAEAGAGVLMTSSDFEELELCSRALIMRDGRITKELRGPDVTKARLTHYCYSQEDD
jgi:ribose transport system ATP-binding protein